MGDMDFKVAVLKMELSLQMDIKITGIALFYEKTSSQAKQGRIDILNEMNKAISKSNAGYPVHSKMEKV